MVKPFSNAASLGIFTEILKSSGPDSLSTMMAAVIMGSAETTFYVLAIYLGAVGIKKTKYLVPVCLAADMTGVVIAIILVKLLYWHLGWRGAGPGSGSRREANPGRILLTSPMISTLKRYGGG